MTLPLIVLRGLDDRQGAAHGPAEAGETSSRCCESHIPAGLDFVSASRKELARCRGAMAGETGDVTVGRVARRSSGEDVSARRFDGPHGPIEAVVYGDSAHAARVVLALHGGPEAAWQLTYEPLFQRLVAEGIAVVAPNQRGSTGYGAAHRDAIRGAWGGPDLADILHLGRVLIAERGPGTSRPILYGGSYGAYLSLLASAAAPDLWARTAVVAPFLSGRAVIRGQDGSGAGHARPSGRPRGDQRRTRSPLLRAADVSVGEPEAMRNCAAM